VLETERLVLRYLTLGDLDELAANRPLRAPAVASHGDPRRRAGPGGCGRAPGGRVTYEIELAYLIGREHWGLGLATEAARAIVDHALRTPPASAVDLSVRSNERRFAAGRRVLGVRLRPRGPPGRRAATHALVACREHPHPAGRSVTHWPNGSSRTHASLRVPYGSPLRSIDQATADDRDAKRSACDSRPARAASYASGSTERRSSLQTRATTPGRR
jgi:hypothetical protein